MSSAEGLACNPGNAPVSSRKLPERVSEDQKTQANLYIGFKRYIIGVKYKSALFQNLKAYV